MAIIDETYFVEPFTVPIDNDNYLNKLDRYIEKVEKAVLIEALGYELWKAFNAELPEPTTQRYIDIIDGAEFTRLDDGELDNWNGLRNTELDSFLAYFTYYDYINNETFASSGQGVTANNFENADRVSPIPKATWAWNEGIKLYNKLYDYLKANETTYPEWHWTQKCKVNILNI